MTNQYNNQSQLNKNKNVFLSQPKLNEINKKLHSTKVRSVWSIVIGILFLLLTFIFIAIVINVPDPGFAFTVFLWLLSIIGIIDLIINIISAVVILTTDFHFERINQSRVLWGVFTIVFLGFIASLIFVGKARRILAEETGMYQYYHWPNQQMYYGPQMPYGQGPQYYEQNQQIFQESNQYKPSQDQPTKLQESDQHKTLQPQRPKLQESNRPKSQDSNQ